MEQLNAMFSGAQDLSVYIGVQKLFHVQAPLWDLTNFLEFRGKSLHVIFSDLEDCHVHSLAAVLITQFKLFQFPALDRIIAVGRQSRVWRSATGSSAHLNALWIRDYYCRGFENKTRSCRRDHLNALWIWLIYFRIKLLDSSWRVPWISRASFFLAGLL